MIRFIKHQKKNYRLSNLWMNTLQAREQKRKALHEPLLQTPIEPVAVVTKRPTIALNQQHVIVTREELETPKEQQQLRSLQSEIADLPGLAI